MDRITGTPTGIGYTGGNGTIEAIAMEPGGNRLFAVDAAQFGEINMTTGVFTPLGAGVGGGFNDVDSLSFDPFTGQLWAADQNGSANDVLFRIDKTTGLAIPGTSVTRSHRHRSLGLASGDYSVEIVLPAGIDVDRGQQPLPGDTGRWRGFPG